MPTMSEERRLRAAAWRSQSDEADIAIAICVTWIADVSDKGFVLESKKDWVSLPIDLHLVDRLSAQGLDGLSSALKWQLEDCSEQRPARADLIGHALAVAAGRYYALHAAHAHALTSCLIASIDILPWEDFADATAESLRNNPGALAAFGDFVAQIVSEATVSPEKVSRTFAPEQPLASLIRRYTNEGTPEDAWSASRWSVDFYYTGVFKILWRADPKIFIKFVDMLPHPVLAEQCLYDRVLEENPQNTLPLLQSTGVAFDSNGGWLRTQTTAIPLLQLATRQLLAPGDRATDANALNEEVARFQEHMKAILDVLFGRPDAIILGWSWLENLLRQEPRWPNAHDENTRNFAVNRLSLLITGLSRRLEPKADQASWIAGAEPSARQYRAAAVLVVSAFGVKSSDSNTGALAQSLLRGDGFELTGASRFITMAAAPLRVIAGGVLAEIPDAPDWFAYTWSSLRFERERAWRQSGLNNSNPAEIMGLWGLGMIEALSEMPQTDPKKVTAMWLVVEKTFREAQLVEVRLGRDFWSCAIPRLFALWRSCIARADTNQSLSASETLSLGGSLIPYIQVDNDFMAVILSLYHAGVLASELDQAVQHTGHDLLLIISRFFEITRGLDNPRVWNPKWLSELDMLKNRISRSRLASIGEK